MAGVTTERFLIMVDGRFLPAELTSRFLLPISSRQIDESILLPISSRQIDGRISNFNGLCFIWQKWHDTHFLTSRHNTNIVEYYPTMAADTDSFKDNAKGSHP